MCRGVGTLTLGEGPWHAHTRGVRSCGHAHTGGQACAPALALSVPASFHGSAGQACDPASQTGCHGQHGRQGPNACPVLWRPRVPSGPWLRGSPAPTHAGFDGGAPRCIWWGPPGASGVAAKGFSAQGSWPGRCHQPGRRAGPWSPANRDGVNCQRGDPSDGLTGRSHFTDEAAAQRGGGLLGTAGRVVALLPASRLCPRPCPRCTGASKAWLWTNSASRSETPVSPSRESATTSPQVSSFPCWPWWPRLPPALTVSPGSSGHWERVASGLLGGVSAASGPGHSAPRSWLSVVVDMCPQSSGSNCAGQKPPSQR